MNTPPVSNNPAWLSGPVRPAQTLDTLLHAGLLAWPDKPAVIHSAGEVSYSKLHSQANAIANSLRECGVTEGDRVAVLLPRGELLVPSLLGVLKLGAAYVPLDASYPVERLRTTLKHAQVACLLAAPALAQNLNDFQPWLDPAAEIDGATTNRIAACENDALPANLIYTSGTTGSPKGVIVSRAAIANLLVALQDVPALDCTDRVLGLTTIAFDIHVLELLAPLAIGATIVLADDTQMTQPASLLGLIANAEVTLVQATPSMWGVLLGAGLPNLPNTRGVAGGERLAPATAIELTRRLSRVWNMYGPTEAAVYTTAKLLDSNSKVSIGKPLANISVAVLRRPVKDESAQAVTLAAPFELGELGELGELAIAGAGLAEGYWQNASATATRFVEVPAGTGSVRAYLTGDLAFIDNEGNVHCQGRLDQQIKLRGHRIELSEIEHALVAHPQLVEAACSVHSYAQDDDRLVAYHTNSTVLESDLRDFVAQRLPLYMVPQRFLCLPQLPRLPSGKLDRSSLPRPQLHNDPPVAKLGVSSDTDRQTLADCWRMLLGGATPENEHNFMDQGGHSLLALRLVQQIAERTGKQLPLRLVVLDSFAALVVHLESQQANERPVKGGILAALKRRFSRIYPRP